MTDSHTDVAEEIDFANYGSQSVLPDYDPPEKTVIIGSKGRMGQMLVEKAKAAGLNVAGIDIPLLEVNIKEACKEADLALFCVPAKYFSSTLAKILPYLPANTILSDITSVKEIPMRQMEKEWNGPVVGTHPLFGPKIDDKEDLPVVLVPGKSASNQHLAKVASFFKSFGCRTFESSAEKHDLAMAKIQNMNFITNLAYFAVMAGQKDLLPFLTPSFERRKNAATKMLNEDAEMFTGLFEANPHSHEAVRQYRKMLNLAASGDIDLLCKRAQWWWKED